MILTGIGVLVALTMIAVLFADQFYGIDHYDLVRDPNAIAGQPGYFGAVSNIGVVFWGVGAVAALQAFVVCTEERERHLGGALMWGGLFAAVMGLDDLLMIHEAIAAGGLPEPIVMIPHLCALLGLCYHAVMLRDETRWPLLGAAVIAFGLSMVVDVFPIAFAGQVFIEESFKLLGIVLLSAYLAALGHAALSRRRG